VKTCNACGISKPEDEFSRDKYSGDSLAQVCPECNRRACAAWYAANRRRKIRYSIERKRRIRRQEAS
jgi:hypothetical protein